MDGWNLPEPPQPPPSRLRTLADEGWRRLRAGLIVLGRPVRDHRWVRLTLVMAGLAILFLVLAGGAAWRTCGFAGCPDAGRLAAYRPGGAPVLLDRHGEVIATLRPDDMAEVSLSALP